MTIQRHHVESAERSAWSVAQEKSGSSPKPLLVVSPIMGWVAPAGRCNDTWHGILSITDNMKESTLRSLLGNGFRCALPLALRPEF